MENTSELESLSPSSDRASSPAGKRTKSKPNGLDPVGIRKIDTQKVIFHKNLDCKTTTDNPKNIIDKLMEKCETKQTPHQRRYPFKLENFDDTISLNPNSDLYYDICIYRQTIVSRDKNLQHFLEGTPELHKIRESKSYNTIYFFYRPGSEIPGKEKDCEIYALPYKHAYSYIQWAVDFNFPKVIARRLLSEKGQLKRTADYLLENRMSSTVTLKNHATSSKLYDIEDLKGVTAEVRPDSSLFDLPIDMFKVEDGTLPVRDLKIEKGQGFVKILKPLTKFDFVYLLDHLAKIDRREPTYKWGYKDDPDHKEPDCYIHDSQFELVVSSEIKYELFKLFESDIGDILTGGNDASRLDGFEFVYKHSGDLVRGGEYALNYRDKEFHVFNHQPSLSDIFEECRNFPPISKLRASLLNGSNRKGITQAILRKFKAIKFQFKIGNQAQDPVKVYRSIEGDKVYEGKVYWWKTGSWFHIPGEQVVQIHTEFVRRLGQVLIEEGSKHNLNHKWLGKRQQELAKVELTKLGSSSLVMQWENIYNLSYSGYGYEEYLVGDRNLTKGEIELFDILKIVIHEDGSKQAYLYHVKKKLGSNTRVALAQLEAAAQIIRGARSGDIGEINSVYEKARIVDGNFLSRLGIQTVHDFIQLFRNSTFVYAFVDPDSKGECSERRMADERSLYTVLSECNICACLEENRIKIALSESERIPFTAWAKLIHDELKTQGYIDGIDQPTSKFLYAAVGENGLDSLQEHLNNRRETVWRLLLNKFLSAYSSLVPKFEILRVDLKNFDFKICEIRVDDKNDLPDVHEKAISLFKKLSDEAKERKKKNNRKKGQ